ncbi:hypothetical protein ACH5RR_028596 [Cinchona calisaya]|uniref:Uncharacterized protein n=1 Tax=Cinchona calisaya TaxID=153742 RepID=A0ABD2YP86_9GENT
MENRCISISGLAERQSNYMLKFLLLEKLPIRPSNDRKMNYQRHRFVDSEESMIQAVTYTKDVDVLDRILEAYCTYYNGNTSVTKINKKKFQFGTSLLQLTLTKSAFVCHIEGPHKSIPENCYPLTPFNDFHNTWMMKALRSIKAEAYIVNTDERLYIFTCPNCSKVAGIEIDMYFTCLYCNMDVQKPQARTKFEVQLNDRTGILNDHIDDNYADYLFGVTTDEMAMMDTQRTPDLCFRLPELEYLNLEQNQFHGRIPSSISHCSAMDTRDLYGNKFTGNVLDDIGIMSMLRNLVVGGNNFTGILPSSIGNMSRLLILRLGWNNFSGKIPPELGKLPILEGVYIHSNQFTGEIAPELGRSSSIGRLYMNYNKITGKIPRSMFNISSLRELGLSRNQFSGFNES